MLKNRSVPADTILPHVTYENVETAIAWLAGTLGFVEHYRYGEPVAGAQMRFGNAWIMLNSPRGSRTNPAKGGCFTQSLSLFVEDVAAHYERVRSAGATIVEELNETGYGERQFVVEDPEGHQWLFSQHISDVDPAEWGASVARD